MSSKQTAGTLLASVASLSSEGLIEYLEKEALSRALNFTEFNAGKDRIADGINIALPLSSPSEMDDPGESMTIWRFSESYRITPMYGRKG